MSLSPRLPVALAVLALAPWGRAQSPAAPAPAGTPAALAASPADRLPAPPPAPAPRRNRAISPEAAAALAANAPKFAPPPKAPEPKPEEELPDLREIDKPKNTIVRLPKFVVQERRPPVFRERDINSTKGLAEIAMRRYLSETDRVLNRFRLPFLSMSSEERAMAMYAEDERLKNMSDFADRANMIQKSDAAAGTYIKREVDKTFLRSSDFGWQGGGPGGRP
jgi:hypothetical protein